MAHLLYIETTTQTCSVALSKDGELLQVIDNQERYSHAAKLTLLIEEVLKKENLTLPLIDAIVVSKGPGSYTGLRIGTSVAKGICYALDKPLIAVDTLTGLAQATFQQEQKEGMYVPMIDARRMEVYTGVFNSEGEMLEPIIAKIIDETAFENWLAKGKVIFSGDGAAKCQEVITHPNAIFVNVVMSASNLIQSGYAAYQAGNFEDVAYFSPFYLKSPNITKSKKKVL